ncbi:VHL beta domain-containing protein [Bradyrhizobium sp. JR3.5]
MMLHPARYSTLPGLLLRSFNERAGFWLLLMLLAVVSLTRPASAEACIPGLDPGCIYPSDRSPRLMCDEESKHRPTSAEVAVGVQFENETGEPVVIYWIDPEGNRKFYNTVQNGESRAYHTYVTHPWLIADSTGNCLMLYLPSNQPNQFVKVKPPSNPK